MENSSDQNYREMLRQLEFISINNIEKDGVALLHALHPYHFTIYILLIGHSRTRRASQWNDFKTREAGLAAPFAEISTGIIETVA